MKEKKSYEQVELLMITFENDVVTGSGQGQGQQVFDNDNVITWFGISEG